jgi:hypothetical protein
VRHRAEAEAAQVEKVGRKGGLSDEALQTIRKEILEVSGCVETRIPSIA